MTQLAQGWNLQVERGPDWLFVRMEAEGLSYDDMPQLAETVWSLMQQNLANRLVLELDQLPLLHSYLVGQLVLLHKRIYTAGGVMRLSSLSESNQRVLEVAQLAPRFPHYDNRADAVRGEAPRHAR